MFAALDLINGKYYFSQLQEEALQVFAEASLRSFRHTLKLIGLLWQGFHVFPLFLPRVETNAMKKHARSDTFAEGACSKDNIDPRNLQIDISCHS